MAKVNIDIEARDFASGVIGNITDALSNGVSAFDLLAAAAASVAVFVSDSIKEFANYTEQVQDFSRATGTTAEEASRMIQIADDVRISFDTLKTAARNAAKDGISLSVDELKKLSDEYLSIQDPAKRAQFLIDNFGKSGLEMGKLLEKGSRGIDALNEGIDENLILTQDAIDAADEYKQSIDALNDSWMATKVTVGQEVVPVITSFLTQLNKNISESGAAMGIFRFGIDDVYQSIVNMNTAARDADTARLEGLASLYQTNDATAQTVELTKEQIKAQTEYGQSILKGAEQIYTTQQQYNQGLADTIAKYGEGSAEVDAFKAKHQEAMRQMQYDLLLTKLATDGLTEAEYQIGVQAGVAFGIFDQESANAMIAQDQLTQAVANGQLSIEAYGAAMEQAMADGVVTASELQSIIAGIPSSKDIMINIRTNASPEASAAMSLQISGEKGYVPRRANGGSVSSGTPYLVGEQGAELFVPSGNGTIIPNNQLGGGGVNITLVYSPAVSTASMTEVESVLTPIINNAVRQGYRGGQLG